MASFMESPRFPDDIAEGVSFGPEFVTAIVVSQTGYESRNRVRSRGLCRGECAHAVKTPAQLSTLLTFFRSVGGRWTGFRFKDWTDFTLAEANSNLALVTGTVNQYQLGKLYQSAVGYSELRTLKKLVSGTVVLKDAGVTVTQGAGAGQYSVDLNTGIITLVASQTRSISAHTVGASHMFTLASALSPNVSVGQKVSVSGVTGTAASVLNGLVLTVSAITGADVTVSVNTTGLTASGGTLSLYRQQVDLTASCEFDVPCRFDTDSMPTRIDAFEVYSWGQIPIVEVLE